MLDGIRETLAHHDLNLTISRVPGEKLGAQGFMSKALREQMSDDLLINCTYALPEPLEQLIAQHGIPAIWINRVAQGDCACSDDFGGAQMATWHLIELGHKRIDLSLKVWRVSV